MHNGRATHLQWRLIVGEGDTGDTAAGRKPSGKGNGESNLSIIRGEGKHRARDVAFALAPI
jgi:hypothetical protein